MTLDEYLRAEKLTEAEFGRRVGKPQQTVNRWRRGVLPSKDDLVSIATVTSNAVMPNDWLPSAPIASVAGQPADEHPPEQEQQAHAPQAA